MSTAFERTLTAVLRRFAALPQTRALLAEGEGARVSACVVRTRCTFSEDWVHAVRHALPFLEGAVREERQFIRSNGEVLPIEKVKRVSKESVQHLSRHADLLGGSAGTDEALPQKLYSVERLNDFATYENRFLYATLCLAERFVAARLQAATRATSAYEAHLKITQDAGEGEEKLAFQLTLDHTLAGEESGGAADSEALRQGQPMLDALERLLDTPLMREAAQADKLRAAPVKTNVLRMDKNFRECVTLYEFLSGYEGEGYALERETLPLSVDGQALTAFALPRALCAALVRAIALPGADEEEEGALPPDPIEEAALLAERNRALEEELQRSRQQAEALEQSARQGEEDAALRLDEVQRRYAALLAAQSARAGAAEEALARTQAECDRLSARLLAGTPPPEAPSDQARIDALEQAFETLGRSLRGEWRGTKRELGRLARADLLRRLFPRGKGAGPKGGKA